jgi:hypothetical protein
MAAGSILISLLLATGSFESDTKRAEKRLQELKKEAEALGAKIGVAFAAVGVAAAALVKSAIDGADAMSKLAQQTGTTVESLSALSYAAKLSDVSNEELGAALVKLTKNMSDTANGSGEAAKGFEALGISVKNADGTLKSSDKVLTEIAEKFAGFKDGAEKTALAVNLFGKSGAQLIPLLNSGAAGLEEMKEEAKALGLVLDTDMARSAEAFNDNLTRMGQAVAGVGNRAATELLPALNEVSEALVDLAKSEAFVSTTTEVMKAAVGGLINVFQTIAVVGSDVGFVFLSVGREIGAWAAQLHALASGNLQGFRAISDAVKEDGERARAELDKFQARIMAIGQPGATSGSTSGDFARDDRAARPPLRNAPRLPGSGGGGAAKQSEAERYLETLQKQVERTQELTAVEQVLLDIQKNRIQGLTPALKEQILAAAEQLDASKRMQEQLKAEEQQVKDMLEWRRKEAEERKRATERIDEENQRLREEIEVITGGEPARRAIEQARVSSAIAILEEKRALDAKGGATQEELAALDKQIAKLRERQGLLSKRDAAEDMRVQMEKNARTADAFADVFGNAFEDFLTGSKSAKESLKDLEKELQAFITRELVINPFKKWVSEAITGAMNGGGGGGGGWSHGGTGGNSGSGDWVSVIGGLIGGYLGGTSSSGSGMPDDVPTRGGRAQGGPVEAGGLYRVNERGRPEMLRIGNNDFLLMGDRRGYVDPNQGAQQRPAQQRSYNLTQNITVQGQVSNKSAAQIGGEAMRGLRRADRLVG